VARPAAFATSSLRRAGAGLVDARTERSEVWRELRIAGSSHLAKGKWRALPGQPITRSSFEAPLGVWRRWERTPAAAGKQEARILFIVEIDRQSTRHTAIPVRNRRRRFGAANCA